MKKLKRWWKANKENLIMSLSIALAVKLAGDCSRTYMAFGGEDLVFIGIVGYWIWNYIEFKGRVKNEQ